LNLPMKITTKGIRMKSHKIISRIKVDSSRSTHSFMLSLTAMGYDYSIASFTFISSIP